MLDLGSYTPCCRRRNRRQSPGKNLGGRFVSVKKYGGAGIRANISSSQIPAGAHDLLAKVVAEKSKA